MGWGDGCGGGEPPKPDDRIGYFGQYGTHEEFVRKNQEFAKSLPPPEPIQERPSFLGIPLGPWRPVKDGGGGGQQGQQGRWGGGE